MIMEPIVETSKMNKRFFYYLIISGIIIFLTLIIFNRCYETVDDPYVVYICMKGGYTPFMSILLGAFISFFYHNVSANIPWYGIILYLIHIPTLALLLKLFWHNRQKSIFTILLFSSFLFLYLLFIINLSYTTLSIMIGGLALLSFLIYLVEEKNPSYGYSLFLGIMFSFSFLLRTDGLKAVMISIFLIAVWFFLRSKEKFLTDFKHIIIFPLPLILVIVFHFYALSHWRDPQWKSFQEYNVVRGKIQGYPIFDKDKNFQEYREIGWTPYEMDMLEHWLHIDENRFNIEKMKLLAQMPRPKRSLSHSIDWIRGEYLEELILLLVLSIIILTMTYNRVVDKLFIIFYIIIVGLAFPIFMRMFLRFPERIGHPVFLLIFLGIYLIWNTFDGQASLRKIPNWTTYFLSFILLVPTGYFLRNFIRINEQIGRKRTEMFQIRKLYDSFGDKAVFLFAGGRWGCYEYQDPLSMKEHKSKGFYSGWMILSPIFYSELKEIGLEKGYQLLPYMVDNNSAFLVCKEELIESVEKFIRQTYSLDVTIVPVDIAVPWEKRPTIYKIISASRE